MKIVRLTPTKYAECSEIAQTIIPRNELKSNFRGSYVEIKLEPNELANTPEEDHENKTIFFGGDKLSIAVYCKGARVGFVPELYSVTKWKGRDDIWTLSVEAVRNQFSLDYTRNGTMLWKGNVYATRYESTAGGITRYLDYMEIQAIEPEQQKKWDLEQISISIDDVE